MSKIFNSIKVGLVGITLAIIFVGCGAKVPTPYTVQLNKSDSIITDSEKDDLLSYSINKTYKHNSFHPNRGWGLRYNKSSWLHENTISYDGLNATFSHKFSINHTTNEFCRTDVSRASNNEEGEKVYQSLMDDFGFTDYINVFQIVLHKRYEISVSNYAKFKRDYLNLKQSKKTFVDKTGVLPKEVLNKLHLAYYLPINIFLRGGYDVYKIEPKNLGRYVIGYETSNFPSKIIFNVNRVKFNYLPNKYIASDKNIDVEVINTPFAYKSIKSIKITNKTKEFIEVDTISGYYGNDVTDHIVNIKDMKKVKISPMSHKIFSETSDPEYRVIDYPSAKSRLLLVSNKNQKIKYGFSVGYKMINQNIIKNLYKVNKYSIIDFGK